MTGTRIVKPPREAVPTAPRGARSAKRKAAIVARQGGRCGCDQGCGEKLEPSNTDFDHAIALALGGSDDDRNIVALTKACHKIKTASDAAKIAKVKRLSGETLGEERKDRAYRRERYASSKAAQRAKIEAWR